MAKKNSSTQGLVLMLVALVVGGVGGIGLIQGMGTDSLEPWASACLAIGGTLFLVSVVVLSKAHSDAPPQFCPRCDEAVDDGDTACKACGTALV